MTRPRPNDSRTRLTRDDKHHDCRLAWLSADHLAADPRRRAVLASGDKARRTSDQMAGAVFAVLTFLVSLPLWFGFDPARRDAVRRALDPLDSALDVDYYLGVDGISMPLILLTTFITIFVIIAGWEVITYRPSQYMAPS
jgi:NADH-quinone oxidoreductase subunit M